MPAITNSKPMLVARRSHANLQVWALGTFLRRREGRAQMASPKADAQVQADAGKQESIVDIIHELEKDEKLGAAGHGEGDAH